MISLFLHTWLAPVWAWALPVIAPVRLAFSLWRAKAVERAPAAPTLLGAAVAVLLGWLAYRQIEAWLDPPPETFTAAEIEAASAKAEVARLKEAVASQARTLSARTESNSRLVTIIEEVQTELENEKRKSSLGKPAHAALAADDAWLRGWEQRGW